MKKFETKRLVASAVKFDIYSKPWPPGVETVVGDIGVPHPVIIGVQGNINLSHGDMIVYLPIGKVVMNDELFFCLFQEKVFQPPLFKEVPGSMAVEPRKPPFPIIDEPGRDGFTELQLDFLKREHEEAPGA